MIKNSFAKNFLAPNWAAPNNVVAVTTTRRGGVSARPYHSLNLGSHVGDDVASVQCNRQTFSEQLGLPSEPVWLDQTHSTDVIQLAASDTSAAAINALQADGAVANCKGLVCAIMTADCMPLFLSNKDGTKVGLLHAGWRGMANGIIEQGVVALDEAPSEILAWAGPTISDRHFEIGQEIKKQLGGPEDAYRPSSSEGKLFADLYKIAAARLRAVGVSHYGHSEYCTYQQEELFYSYRRDGMTGRMASLIYLR